MSDKFYNVPGTCEITYFDGVPLSTVEALVKFIDGDSSLGDVEVGYDEYQDTFEGTFSEGLKVLFDRETGIWYES